MSSSHSTKQATLSDELKIAISNASSSKRKIAAMLNEAGINTHKTMQRKLDAQFAALPASSRYSFCIAEALGWADFGTREAPLYYEKLTAFFDGKISYGQVPWNQLSGRWGTDPLMDAANGYMQFMPYVPAQLRAGAATAAEMTRFQDEARSRAFDFAKQSRLHGFGGWLFSGPTKILAIMKPELWIDPELQRLQMPLGNHVMKAFKFLAKIGIRGIDPVLLDEKESGLSGSAFGTLFLGHAFQSELAQNCPGSLILHVNTGLHHLGGGGACT